MEETKSVANLVINFSTKEPLRSISILICRGWTRVTHLMCFACEGMISIGSQFLLRLTHQCIEASFHIGQLVPDMMHESLSLSALSYQRYLYTDAIQSL